ncbi:exosortase E/protease, VPEID-CTERM system, partial [Cribrihabitans sp. XS_ASV171]
MAGAPNTGRRRLLTVAALATLELLAIILVYQVMASIECRLTEMELACRALRSMTARGLAVLTALALFFWLRRTSFHRLTGLVKDQPGSTAWWGVHVFGLALIFLPLPLFGADAINDRFLPSLMMMGVGGLCAAAGALLATARAGAWTAWLRGDGFLLPLVLAGALLVPDLADSLRPLWYLRALTDITFALVYFVLLSTGAEVWADLSIHVIGLDGFNVQVGSPCSGVE